MANGQRQTCWSPAVNRAAWAVLQGIVPNGIDPNYMPEWRRTAEEVAAGRTVEILERSTWNVHKAIGWHTFDGIVWLVVPDYEDYESRAWRGAPMVTIEGDATPDDALTIMQAMARQLGVEP